VADVDRIIRRDFSVEQYDAVFSILQKIGEPEVPRVQLAVLKLAGGDIEQVVKYTEVARSDYRDILMWAEYPEMGRYSWSIFADKEAAEFRETSYARDWEQYQRWLNR